MNLKENLFKSVDGFDIYLIETHEWRDWYILEKKTVSEIVQNIQEGHWCTILGPPRSQKSFHLYAIRDEIDKDEKKICIISNMRDLNSESDEKFISSFASFLRITLSDINSFVRSINTEDITTKNDLLDLFSKCLESQSLELVLLIDHSEKIHTPHLELLLDVLREIKSIYDGKNSTKLVVVSANSFRTASLALDIESPFNSSALFYMQDLSIRAIKILLGCISKKHGVEIDQEVHNTLVSWFCGDRYLIAMICETAIKKLPPNQKNLAIDIKDIRAAIDSFFADETKHYPIFKETIWAIELKPYILLDLLKVLKNTQISIKELIVPPDIRIDELLLTGAVSHKKLNGQKTYLIRNKIYKRWLNEYFDDNRVFDILTTSGRWKEVMLYYEGEIKTPEKKKEYSHNMIHATLYSIYESKLHREACKLLIKAIQSVFDVTKSHLYIENKESSKLDLVSQSYTREDKAISILLSDKKKSEIMAYDSKRYRIEKDGTLNVPLLGEDRHSFGLVKIFGFDSKGREKVDELLVFLNRAGKAIWNVIESERRAFRLDTILYVGNIISRGNLNEKEIFNKIAHAIFNISGAVGSSMLLLCDPHDPDSCNIQEPAASFTAGVLKNIDDKIRPRENGLTRKAIETKATCEIKHPEESPGINPVVSEKGIKACICCPMISHETVFGVLFIHFNEPRSFSENEKEIFSLFANLAAAIEHTRLMFAIKGEVVKKERQTKRLKFLQDIGAEIMSDLELDRFLKTIAKNIVNLLSADRSLFILFDYQKGEIIQITGEGYEESHCNDLTFKELNDGFSGWVYYNNIPAYSENGSNDDRNRNFAKETAKRLKTGPVIVVPLYGRNKIIGTLTAVRENNEDNPPEPFTQDDLDLACMLANHAAIAVENNDLFSKSRIDAAKTFHSIKGKSSAIKGDLDNLKEAIAKGYNTQTIINNISDCTKTLETITTRLVNISTPKSLNFQKVDLAKTIKEVNDELNIGQSKIGITIHVEIQHIITDEDLLKEALKEVITNSLSALGKDHIGNILFRVAHARKDQIEKFPMRFLEGGIAIQIEDDGPGIPWKNKARIFELGFTLTPGGTGLGLFIVAQNVNELRGFCYEDGFPNFGAKFNILLPMMKKEV